MEKTNYVKLKLYFKDANNLQRTLSVERPKNTYTDQEIISAMDNIINTNVLQTKKGLLTKRAKAEKETIQKTPYNI